MSHIALFNLSVAEILSACYQEFPVRIDISDRELADKVLAYYERCTADDTLAISKQLFDIAASTIEWLAQAGYIWIGGREHNYFFGLTLSPTGLALLVTAPSSGDALADAAAQSSIGEQLLTAQRVLDQVSQRNTVMLLLAAGAKQRH